MELERVDGRDCHDEGCELSGSCLRCSLARCVHDEPRGKRSWRKQQRARKVSRLFARGNRVKELALMFGVSPRTVRRDLKETGLNNQITRNNNQTKPNDQIQITNQRLVIFERSENDVRF